MRQSVATPPAQVELQMDTSAAIEVSSVLSSASLRCTATSWRRARSRASLQEALRSLVSDKSAHLLDREAERATGHDEFEAAASLS
jgi:hypothetical protein